MNLLLFEMDLSSLAEDKDLLLHLAASIVSLPSLFSRWVGFIPKFHLDQ
jgi:hypothetical protein